MDAIWTKEMLARAGIPTIPASRQIRPSLRFYLWATCSVFTAELVVKTLVGCVQIASKRQRVGSPRSRCSGAASPDGYPDERH
jgi:hypothetical protein